MNNDIANQGCARVTGQTGDKISGTGAGAGAVAHECTSSATAHV